MHTNRRASFTLSTTALVAALTLTGAAISGCTTPAPGPAASSTAAPAAEAATLPDTVLGEHAAWILEAMNGDLEPIDIDAGIAERFDAAMLEQLSVAELRQVIEQLQLQGPWRIDAVDVAPDAGTQAVITIRPAEGDALDMQIAVDGEDLVAGLFFAPSAADRTPSTSWAELEDVVESFAADTTMVVTEVDAAAVDPDAKAGAGASGTPGAELAADRLLETGDPAAPHPSGSIFKLYVLGAVADAVEAGSLTWDTALTITDDIKSLPSGELQNEPAGTTVTVREAAEKMIAISDNTATDLLIATVGPEAVEAALADMGHHDPSLNTPMPTTRALFQLGWGPAESRAGTRDRWSAADETERRAMLDSLPGGIVTVDPADLTDSVWQRGLDWFTSADDLVAAHVALQQRATTDAGAPLGEILSANPGLGTIGEEWSTVAFKGGSSIGVLAGSWYLERASDGKAFVISIQGETDTPTELADMATFFGQVEDAVALLAAE
ncbi:serine hydrolase [Herbiconiux sp. CPCC 203407]|uniref:Serine hydrolase n=1 Tax=Herbiconiux oxytropis TaxID=2970915 RepID=A0AA42BUI5_9MICO|nr:serine hydrolase [Herbiconiux oxytropis]MCS5722707.1 serine hydrolase [Herbiconiux oxytropis]MCS5725404.1 serine hydrolase [Herbiconiux oxytropis]